MPFKYCTSFLAALLVALLAGCDSSSNSPTEREIRIDYLADNTGEISIDPADKDFSDLQSLGEAIGDARIVTLGEATHGEGNIFEAKARVVEYLVRERGFEVIAFESPLYDMHKALLNIEDGGDIDANLEKAIFTIWTASSEFRPMMNLMSDLLSNGTAGIAGVDPDFFKLSSESLVEDLKEVLAGSGIDMNSADWTRFETLLQELVATKWNENSMDDSDKSTFDGVLDDIKSRLESGGSDPFWRQMVASIEAEAERRWIAKNGGPANSVGGLRDLQMGDNLLWLSEEFYPDKKIVLWAANIHNARDLSSAVALEDPDFSFADYETIGKVAGEVLGDDLYVISFTGLIGRYARWFEPFSHLIETSSENSIESLLGTAGRDHTFLDLRNPGQDGAWLGERLLAKPFGYVEMEANWPEVTDGFFFVRNISPSTEAN